MVSVAYVQDEFGQQPLIQTATQPLRVARSAVAVEKTIVAPELLAVGVGTDITFGIRVENTGAVTLARMPVRDLYEADVLRYLSTSISSPQATVSGDDGELF